MMKLNGWQRLWVLASIIVFVIIVFFTIVLFPKKSEIMSKWVYDTIEVVKKPREYSFKIRDAYRDFGDKELIDKIHEKYVEKDPFIKIRFDEIDKRYRNELESLFIKQAKHILIAFVVYFCLILALYGFGWSIGWIYRGFKNTRSSR